MVAIVSVTPVGAVRAFGRFLAVVTLVLMPLFLFTDDSQLSRFAKVTPVAAVVILVVTGLGLAGAERELDRLAATAAGLAVVTALLQLAQTGRDSNLIGGNASTFSFLLALALGWGGVAIALVAQRGEPEVGEPDLR